MRVLHWFRSDLRAADNMALAAAAARAGQLACCFVLDEHLLRSERQGTARIALLHASLEALREELAQLGQTLIVRRGDPVSELGALARKLGAISVRDCVRAALAAARRRRSLREGVEQWIDERVWRDFYHAQLAEQPRMLRAALRPELADLEWNDDEAGLQAWREARTGSPFVDAAMRELLATGWVHNRARRVAASFLAKDLGIEWREGERGFMQRPVDGEPASNSGGWQWSASTGRDAQPYFRIMNPVSQGEKFDPDGEYVRRFVPELRGLAGARAHRPGDEPLGAPAYPPRIVDHAEAREQALARFRSARGGSS
jgi:deoxyribodipyrimidine photo-lyase